jgi:3-oxoacyl-[acyl-carrier-protein] synthase II
MNRVVITGLGAVSPIGNDIQSIRAGLKSGACGIAPITRFDAADHKVKVAAEVKQFDGAQCGIDPSDARKMDLFAQFALAAAAQAVQDSGIGGTVDAERFGVYVGSGIGGMYTFIAEAYKLKERGPSRVSPFFIPMMISNIAAGHIAIRFHAQGPCLPIVTACATSTDAIGEAFRAIRHGYADAIIAGGAEATIVPLAMAGFANMKALSQSADPDAASLPFDARRDGFVMGEGAGVVVLEAYERAKKRGAHIYAEVAGYGNTCDAYHMTAPDPEAGSGSRAIELALREAGYAEDLYLYVNAHGTGTPMNDKVETLALKKALSEDALRRVKISSTKSMTGHMLGAAGGFECIASTLALTDGFAPPTIHLSEPDPACDLDYTPNAAADYRADMAVSISMGFGGHNGVIALRRFA